MEKKKLYVLIYSVDDCECQWSSTVVASFDLQKIEKYKDEIETKSAILREKLKDLDIEKWDNLKPLSDKMRAMIKDKSYNKPEHKEEYVSITNDMSEIHQNYFKQKNKLLSEIALDEDYFIDNIYSQGLTIDELQII